MIHVVWPDWDSRASWDQNIVLELTADDEFQHGKAVPLGEGAVVVIPGQHHVLHAAPLAESIARLPWALTIITSDEEALFPVELLPHDDKHAIFGQYHARPEFDRVIPIGAQPGTKQRLALQRMEAGYLEPDPRPRDLAVSFIGQDTHARRHELLAVIKEMACEPDRYGNIAWLATTGFRQGVDQDEYLATLARTRIAPCPSGPHSLDSFRLYETLAAGCIPIIETHTPHGDEGEFWDALFGPYRPIPRLASWADGLPLIAKDCLDPEFWHGERDDIQTWWQAWRAGLSRDFAATIERLRS